MILPPKKTDLKRRKIAEQLQQGVEPAEKFVLGYLKEDPYDWFVLMLMGTLTLERGELEQAEEWFWRSIRAAPNQMAPYIGLSQVYGQTDDDELKTSFLHLAVRRGVYDEEQRDVIMAKVLQIPDADYELGPTEQEDAIDIARALSRPRTGESARVTKLLAPLRWIQDVLDPEIGGLDELVVDSIVENPAESTPLLVAVIRAFLEGMLGGSGLWSAKVSIALLGEIGDPAHIPDLLDLFENGDPDLADALIFATLQMFDQNPSLKASVPQAMRDEITLTLEDFLAYQGPEEDEEEAEEMEEPVRPEIRLGRNDPCWCGSGKKYKKCHLASDESRGREREQESDDSRIAKLILTFMDTEVSRGDFKEAVAAFLGGPEKTIDSDDTQIAFYDWFINDHATKKFGRPVIDEFLARQGPSLTERDRVLAEQWSHSRFSLFEVLRVDRGVGVQVKDLLYGDAFFVNDVTSSKQAKKSDWTLSRVREESGKTVFTATGMLVPAGIRDHLFDWIIKDRDAMALDWPKYLRANSHRLRLEAARMAEEWRNNLRIVSAEGDEFIFCKRFYKVLDRPAVVAALTASSAIGDPVEKDGEVSFPWLEGTGDGPRRSLGTISVRDDRLTLECQSRQRLARGEKLLSEIAGAFLEIGEAEFTDAMTALGKQ